MSRDPLRVLRAYDSPVTPDPEFAARVRRRMESVITGRFPRPAALPYLTVPDARAAITWYSVVFGAAVRGEPIVMDDNRIGHVELAVAGGVLYLADEFPELRLTAPSPTATSVSLMLPVADTDATMHRARDNGARILREPREDHGARNAVIIDPFGHRWILTGPATGENLNSRQI